MTADELHKELVDAITAIIIKHQLPDYGVSCSGCPNKRLYSTGDGSTLSRHRAEKIVDELDLVELHLSVEKKHGSG